MPLCGTPRFNSSRFFLLSVWKCLSDPPNHRVEHDERESNDEGVSHDEDSSMEAPMSSTSTRAPMNSTSTRAPMNSTSTRRAIVDVDDDDDEEEDDDFETETPSCFARASWPNYRLCSQHGWCLFWAPLLAFVLWYLYFRLIIASTNPFAPVMASGLFMLGLLAACFMPRPGKHVWFFCLPCLWFSITFPGSYSFIWADIAPLPNQTHHRTCSASESFGSSFSSAAGLPRLISHSAYFRGECADPVCGFVFSFPTDLNLPGRRRPVFVSHARTVSHADELPEACRTIAASGTVDSKEQAECSLHCKAWFPHGQRWRYVVHHLLPFCSIVAGWGKRGGGSVYLACGKSEVALLHLGNPVVMLSLAFLYSLPLLAALAKELREYRRANKEQSQSDTPEASRFGSPCTTACLPDGRFSSGKLWFPYCFVKVKTDAEGERVCAILESMWVIPDVPMDIMTCLIYLRTGCAHRASAVLASILFVGDPFQVQGAKAMTSRWSAGYPTRTWWEYRGKQGTCESGLSTALAFYSLVSDLPNPSLQGLMHTLTLCFSAGTSLLAVSAGAEAHSLVHLADHASLNLREYYSVMRVRKRLGPVRMAAMLRILSSAWAAALAERAGRLEMVGINLCSAFLETLARTWDTKQRTMRLALVAQACRYLCLMITATTLLMKATYDWDDLWTALSEGYTWHDPVAFASSLCKAGCALIAGPLALLASPVADVMAHRAFNNVRFAVGSRLDLMAEDEPATGSYYSPVGSHVDSLGTILLERSLDGSPTVEHGESFELGEEEQEEVRLGSPVLAPSPSSTSLASDSRTFERIACAL